MRDISPFILKLNFNGREGFYLESVHSCSGQIALLGFILLIIIENSCYQFQVNIILW